MITLLGAAFLFYLAVESIRIRGVEVAGQEVEPHSIRKGFMVNLLNPHPYLFWFSVGAPTILKANAHSLFSAAAFIISFFALLIGSKVFLAILVSQSKSFLKGKAYLITMRLLGAGLMIFAFILFRDGLGLIGIMI